MLSGMKMLLQHDFTAMLGCTVRLARTGCNRDLGSGNKRSLSWVRFGGRSIEAETLQALITIRATKTPLCPNQGRASLQAIGSTAAANRAPASTSTRTAPSSSRPAARHRRLTRFDGADGGRDLGD